jgi:hypothetical protein
VSDTLMRLVFERCLRMLHPLLTLSASGHRQFADAFADQTRWLGALDSAWRTLF